MAGSEPLECPACGARGEASERFCKNCGSPLVVAPAGEAAVEEDDPARVAARKVHPPYAEGELVRVARAANQPEAELIAGLLLEAGVPSMSRRAGGFDVPDFLAAGPRDVLVPAGGAEVAREVLGERAPAAVAAPAGATARPWVRTLALILAFIVVAAVVAGVVSVILD